jgi:alkylation response protein AidB-like acyl-CoA dehydrogenase
LEGLVLDDSQAKLAGGPHAGHDARVLLDKATPGIEEVRTPLFSHTFDHHHPTLRFNQVFVPVENRLGAEGGGMANSHSWFRRERLMIAARCCGAMARMTEEVTGYARTRMVGGEPLIDKQLVQAMLADNVTDLWASRLITFETAEAHDRGEDVKVLHARCSVAKLFASEAAGRVADRTLQIFGGRGYMRENCAERFSRELRVDRIWEGASEVQRLVIARALAKRGLEEM